MAPLLAFIVATAVFEEVQTPPATVDVNVLGNPKHTFWSPLNVPANGIGSTVIVLVAGGLVHPAAVVRL